MKKFPDDHSLVETAVSLSVINAWPEKALDIAFAALETDPNNPKTLALAGLAHEQLGNLPEAIEVLERAARASQEPSLLRDLSRFYAFTNQAALALDAARKALASGPNDPLNAFTLAWREIEMGLFEQARGHFQQSLANETVACDALRMLSAFSDGPTKPQIDSQADELAATAKTQTDRGHLCMARFNAALKSSHSSGLQHLVEANQHYARDRTYDVREDARYHEKILQAFDKADFIVPSESQTGTTPIFILGMIRTGTTLLDRLLSPSPQVSSLGEVAVVDRFFRNRIETLGAEAIDLGLLASRYARYQSLIESNEFTLDKMPVNYIYMGWLARAFPNCKVILMERDMRDVAASAFTNYFDSAQMGFTFRENWLIKKFELYRAQISAWEQRGVDVLKVAYETLVTKPAETVGEIADFCNLKPFPEVDLASREGSIRTASFAQARQKIGTSSIGRWKLLKETLPGICAPN